MPLVAWRTCKSGHVWCWELGQRDMPNTCLSWMGEKELPSSSATPGRLQDNRPGEEGYSPPGHFYW